MKQLERASKVPLPEQIAGTIESMIAARTWRVGERIPSVRESAGSFGVSPTTVAQAYGLLVVRGVVEARDRSGYYVGRRHHHLAGLESPRPAKNLPLEPHQVRPLGIMKRMHRASDRADMVELGTALPDVSFLPHAELGRAMKRVLQRSTEKMATARVRRGAIELRRELSRHLLGLGVAAAPDELLITVGATEALFLTLGAVAQPGDTVALESPTYYGFLQALRARGLRALELPSDPNTGMDTRALERVLDRGVPVRAVITTPAVSNPLGATMSAENRQRLASLARAHDLTIIEDMTYTDLAFHQEDRRALACDEGVLVVRFGSLSKSLAPGYRIGWCLPGGFEDRVRFGQMTTTTSSPTPTQLVAAEMMRDGSFERCLDAQRSEFADKTEVLRELVARAFPEGTRVTRPHGGHVLWVELADVEDTTELFERCVARGVSFAPGELFSNTDAFRHSLRLNAALVWDAEERRGLEVIAEEIRAMTR